MSTLQPESASFLLNTFLPMLKSEQATTLKVIQAIPIDKGDYKPDPISKSADELAWHLVALEHRILAGIPDGKFNFDAIPRPAGGINSANVSAWYTKNFAADLDRFAKTSPVHLAQTIDFRGLFQLPGIAYIQFLLNHSIHHRGQLTMYLRPMGSEVPSIYGESYAAAQARQAASAKS